MCDGVAEEESKLLQVLCSGSWASDDVFLDCHRVEMRRFGNLTLMVPRVFRVTVSLIVVSKRKP